MASRIPRLKLMKFGAAWWIVGDEEPMGPYRDRARAEDSRLSVLRFYRHKDEPGYVTVERPGDDWVKW